MAGMAVHKHCDSKRKNNPFTHLCRGMWEGFKVTQIVLANTGMENAASPPAETIPKLAASAVDLSALLPSLLAKEIQIVFGGYLQCSLTLWSPELRRAPLCSKNGKEQRWESSQAPNGASKPFEIQSALLLQSLLTDRGALL